MNTHSPTLWSQIDQKDGFLSEKLQSDLRLIQFGLSGAERAHEHDSSEFSAALFP